jgi:GTPase SAR1 family protein
VGDVSVGKTCIALRYVVNNFNIETQVQCRHLSNPPFVLALIARSVDHRRIFSFKNRCPSILYAYAASARTTLNLKPQPQPQMRSVFL